MENLTERAISGHKGVIEMQNNARWDSTESMTAQYILRSKMSAKCTM
jgi:hypothetical protein